MPLQPKTVLVTGANRGIGLAICQLLLRHQATNEHPIHLLAASRTGNSLDLNPGSQNRIDCQRLDISDSNSIHDLATSISRSTSSGGLDVLINNAGINLDNHYTAENARKTLSVNYRGTLEMCKAFLPLLRKTTSPNDPSRIVNMSSVASSLKAYSPTIQALLRSSAISMAWSDLSDITEKYLTSVANGTEESAGFGPLGRAYSFSKATVNALTFILARENPDILINACCPGWVATDMGRQIGRAPKSVEDGAKIPVRLAVGDIGNVTGRYWANQSVRGKGEGEVREW